MPKYSFWLYYYHIMVKKYDSFKETLKEGFLGIPSSPIETFQDEEPPKVTILLPRDTLDYLDELVRIANVGSRGRFIQILIDDLDQMYGAYNLLRKTITAYGENTISENQFFTRMIMGITNILGKLDRYYQQSSTQPKTSDTKAENVVESKANP